MLNTNQSQRLVKHIIRSYARLSENTRVRSILKDNLPNIFKERTFQESLDETSRRWIQNICKHLNITGNGLGGSKQSGDGTNISQNNGNNGNEVTLSPKDLKEPFGAKTSSSTTTPNLSSH
jgi:hypothetical protein